MNRLLRSALRLVAAIGLVAFLALPSPASAHASLVSSSPEQGQQLARLPDRVDFEFNQDMSSPAYVIVTAPDGSSVTDGDPVVEGAEVTQALTDGPDGSYTMAYRAVSEDGHPVTGEITFTVGAASSDPASDSPAPATTDRSTASSGDEATDESFLGRHLLVIGVGVVLFGAAAVLLLIARRSPE